MGESTASCIGGGACVSLVEGLTRLRNAADAGKILSITLDDGMYDEDTVGGDLNETLRTFDSGVLASSVIITSASMTPGGATIRASAGSTFPIFKFAYGDASVHSLSGLRVTLRGLTIKGSEGQSESAPALLIDGGQLIVEDCAFTANPASAVKVTGGVTSISTSTFLGNGLLNSTEGGAIKINCPTAASRPVNERDCSITAEATHFEGNLAAQGGVLYSMGRSSKSSLIRCTLTRNRASLAGGALYADAGKIYLSNQTKVFMNVAPQDSGKASFVVNGRINYALPAPLGHFADATFCKLYRVPCSDPNNCDPSTRPPMPDQPCDPDEYDRYLARMPQGALDDNLPYLCLPGTYGATLNPVEQMSSRCSGSCPAGHYCSVGAVEPIECQTGTYCPTGSPMEIPCNQGTYGTRPRLIDQSECVTCEAGGYCTGGQRTTCIPNFYNNNTGSSLQSDCVACPEYSTTVGPASVQLRDCTCKTHLYFTEVPLSDGPPGSFKCECEPG